MQARRREAEAYGRLNYDSTIYKGHALQPERSCRASVEDQKGGKAGCQKA
jgi:hypothetical protein